MNWDQYYLGICKAVAKKSSCLSRQIGAIIVYDKSIIATGFNGPPRGVPHCGSERLIHDETLSDLLLNANVPISIRTTKCPRQALGYKSGEGLHLCIAGHAERNALINAAREGVAVKGCTMFMDCGIPCTPCLIEIINAGIAAIVVTGMDYYDTMSKFLIQTSSLQVRIFT